MLHMSGLCFLSPTSAPGGVHTWEDSGGVRALAYRWNPLRDCMSAAIGVELVEGVFGAETLRELRDR